MSGLTFYDINQVRESERNYTIASIRLLYKEILCKGINIKQQFLDNYYRTINRYRDQELELIPYDDVTITRSDNKPIKRKFMLVWNADDFDDRKKW